MGKAFRRNTWRINLHKILFLNLGPGSGDTALKRIKVLRAGVPRLDVALFDALHTRLRFTAINLQSHPLVRDPDLLVKIVHHYVKGALTPIHQLINKGKNVALNGKSSLRTRKQQLKSFGSLEKYLD